MSKGDYSKEEIERATRKIKHCLALSSSANEHEAAAAMRQAKKLMDKYRLTETDIQLSDVGQSYGKVERVKLKRWERELGAMVATTFSCQSFTETQWNREKLCRTARTMFVGVAPAPEIARYAYDALHAKATYARREYAGRLKAAGVRNANTRGDHFALAWVYGVSDKLRALVPTGEDGPDESAEKALVCVAQRENELIDAYMFNITNGKGPAQARPSRDVDMNSADMLRGVLAGRATEVGHGIGTATDSQGLIGAGQ